VRYAKVGGQAVIEGVMMRYGNEYAIAVRKPNHEIEVKKDEYRGMVSKLGLRNVPIIRGVFAFIDSFVLGMSTLTYSASFYEEESTSGGAAEKTPKKYSELLNKAIMALTVVIAVVFAVGLFMVLPFFVSNIFKSFISSRILLAILEGVVRIGLFLTYIVLISRMEDIKRVFMYHGAEHKTINCIEHGEELNVENAKKYSRLHKRCGTSFLLIVMVISSIFIFFITVDNVFLKVLIRILLLPVIAGISYEVIQWAGRGDSALVNIISKPGMWLQKLTTREPEDDMLEIAIMSLEAIYDWKEFQRNGESEA